MYRSYLLGVLLVILAFTNMDVLMLGMLTQSIKLDLHLTDTQVGVLSGIAFALFYSVMGIPLARWADSGNRVTILAVTTLAWGLTVAACGLAASFAQLMLIRIGVAVGEAGCVPTAHSLIADYFNRAERARAVGIYMLGGSVSLLVGYFVTGWLNEFYGWRATFMLIGLPALGPAVLAWATLREPRRARRAPAEHDDALVIGRLAPNPGPTVVVTKPTFRQLCTTLWGNMTFRHVLYCYSVVYFFGFGLAQWQPVFFIRSYGLSTGELGTWLAVITGSASLLGTYLGGALASRYAVNNEPLQLKAMAIAYGGFGFVTALVYLSSQLYAAFMLLAVAGIGVAMTTGPLFATVQTLVPAHMRAMSIAIIYFVANLIGMGLGPLTAGALSDALQPIAGSESLRYALLILCPGYLWGSWHLWRASKTVTRDLQAVQESALATKKKMVALA